MNTKPGQPQQAEVRTEKSPSSLSLLWREVVKDKLAFSSILLLSLILLIVYGSSLLLEQDKIVKVDLLSIYAPPSGEHWLGTDYGGRDIWGQLIIGARNSFTIHSLRDALAWQAV